MIVDASVALSWFFKDEQTPATMAVFRSVKQSGATVPAIWRIEVANVFRTSERKGRVTTDFVESSLQDLDGLSIIIDPETNAHAWGATLALARAHNLTLYDAAYLELALRRGLPLATLDAELRVAAQALALPVLGI